MIITSEAVVLNSKKYGETSKIVSLFTKEQGKLSFIAKGARSKNNKFGSLLEPLNCISAAYYFKPGRDLQIISSVDLLFPVRKIQNNIENLAYALSVLEAVTQSLPPLEQNVDIYMLLYEIISIYNSDDLRSFSYFAKSQMELSAMLGFAIDFGNHQEYLARSNGSSKMFSLENGSIVDNINNFNDNNQRNNIYIEEKILENFIILSKLDLRDAENVFFSKKDMPLVVNFFTKYFGFHLERKFFYKSLNIMNIF